MNNRKAAIKIVKKLRNAGFKTLFAGGCVRDMLLGIEANDYDVATNAKPDEVIELFKRTVRVGAKFGVVVVLIEKEQIEVATFRVEGGYSDGRHPSYVDFADAVEDAKRRDFTVNAMFYDPLNDEVIDYTSGREDLQNKIIRTVGNPDQRFGEDYLRMLRAVRFSAQLGFEIEESTWRGICKNAEKISLISGERIACELERLLAVRKNFEGVRKLIDSTLAGAIFPDFEGEKAEFGIEVLKNLSPEPDISTALAGVFSAFDTEFAVKSCRKLKLSGEQNKKLQSLLEQRGKLLNYDMSLAELKLAGGDEYFRDLFDFQTAIQKAKGESLSALEKLDERIKAMGDIALCPPPLLNGHDLMELGIEEGKSLGEIQSKMYIAQLNEEINSKKEAVQWIKNNFNKERN
jgi:tRNA nucleotidyltransferase/poly(A) polymerase